MEKEQPVGLVKPATVVPQTPSRCNLSAEDLRSAHYGVQTRAGKQNRGGRVWRPNDTATTAEFIRRALVFRQTSHMAGCPGNLRELCVWTTPTGQVRRQARWGILLGAVAAAYTAGRTGVLLSTPHLAVLMGSCMRTVSRDLARMERLGLIKRQHTYRGIDGEYGREYGPSVIQLGRRALRHTRGSLDPSPAGRRCLAAGAKRFWKAALERVGTLVAATKAARTPTRGNGRPVGSAPLLDPHGVRTTLLGPPPSVGEQHGRTPPAVEDENYGMDFVGSATLPSFGSKPKIPANHSPKPASRGPQARFGVGASDRPSLADLAARATAAYFDPLPA